mmetsp:Transcript_6976/g.16948  ORF Transcript_6976/g.16948 Transcript_6976/m.16948 type:complete len:326 (-) Transcript_6976:52-1029(-)
MRQLRRGHVQGMVFDQHHAAHKISSVVPRWRRSLVRQRQFVPVRRVVLRRADLQEVLLHAPHPLSSDPAQKRDVVRKSRYRGRVLPGSPEQETFHHAEHRPVLHFQGLRLVLLVEVVDHVPVDLAGGAVHHPQVQVLHRARELDAWALVQVPHQEVLRRGQGVAGLGVADEVLVEAAGARVPHVGGGDVALNRSDGHLQVVLVRLRRVVALKLQQLLGLVHEEVPILVGRVGDPVGHHLQSLQHQLGAAFRHGLRDAGHGGAGRCLILEEVRCTCTTGTVFFEKFYLPRAVVVRLLLDFRTDKMRLFSLTDRSCAKNLNPSCILM